MSNWTNAQAPTLDDIETLAREAFAGLPEEFRALTGEIVFMVQEFPDADVIEDMELASDFDILGLFSGPNLAAHEGVSASGHQTMIFLYRRPILDYWAEHAEPFGQIGAHVPIHGVRPYFGLSDDDMEAIEERE